MCLEGKRETREKRDRERKRERRKERGVKAVDLTSRHARTDKRVTEILIRGTWPSASLFLPPFVQCLSFVIRVVVVVTQNH